MSDPKVSTGQAAAKEKLKYVYLYFASAEKDANNKNKGTKNLEVKLTAGSTTHEFLTGGKGELPVAIFSGDTAVCTVSVKLPNGQVEALPEIVLIGSVTAKTFISPYIVKKTITEQHVGEAPQKTDKPTPDTIKKELVGTCINTRSEKGNPVTVVVVPGECYEPANAEAKLKLGNNVIYRDYIIDASNRSGIIPPAIATLISIEAASEVWTPSITLQPNKVTSEEAAKEAASISAAKAADAAEAQKENDAIAAAKLDKTKQGQKTTAKLVKEAKEKAKTRAKKDQSEAALRVKRAQPIIIDKAFRMWDPKSMNDEKEYPLTAAGLTQFIAGTWVGEALRKGTYLCEYAIGEKLVKEIPNPPVKKMGKLIPLTADQNAQNDKIKKENLKITDKKKHVGLIKQQKGPDTEEAGKGSTLQLTDEEPVKALRKLYDLRFNPKISIMASIDYAMYNLKQFAESYDDPEVMANDANKAKIMYLTHHLGLGDARKFMANKIKEEDEVLMRNGKPVLHRTGPRKDKPVMILGAETLLRAQFKGGKPPKPELADEWYKANHKNWILAHRSWLCDLIDRKVEIKLFACDGATLPEADDLFDMIKTLDGKHPAGFVVTIPEI